MSYTKIPISVNASTGLIVDENNDLYALRLGSKPQIQAESKFVLCVHFVDPDGNDYPLDSGDTFELGIDIDYFSDKDEGTLSGTLTAGNPVTSITGAALTETDIPTTGHLRLYTSSNVSERIEYTDYDSSTGVFTVDHTMVTSFANGDRLVVEDELMCYSGNSQVDIAGDWADIDRATGKISIRIDATADIFKTKLGNSVKTVHIEIRRYPAGETTPSTILFDDCQAKPTVIDGNENPAVTNPSFLTETSADARYQRKDTDAVENNIPIFDVNGNGVDSGKGFNDAGTGANDILSAEKIYTELAKKTDKIVSGTVDGTALGDTTILTIPTAKRFLPLRVIPVLDSISGSGTPPSFKIKVDSTDIMTALALAMTTANKCGFFGLNTDEFAAAASVLAVEITNASTYDTYNLTFIIEGIQIDA